MKKFLLVFLLFASCSISFNRNVQVVDTEYFYENICSIDTVTKDFKVIGEKPHICLFYDDYVVNCEKQAKIFNEISVKYSAYMNFYAVNVTENSLLAEILTIKKDDKLPQIGIFPPKRQFEIIKCNGIVMDYNTLSKYLEYAFGINTF
ncbi:MAG: hypothetical protein VZQ51_03425 [Bacteroidales bacterium]|nr:hypothetical protein [Bacteroidales bacterium]MEE3447646.1 hypothetical protein [Bacteroidales bacterium]